jgi:hypothetical protein
VQVRTAAAATTTPTATIPTTSCTTASCTKYNVATAVLKPKEDIKK